MSSLATRRTRQAMLLEEPVGAYRVGWFEQVGLVFAEGSPAAPGLLGAEAAPLAVQELIEPGQV